MFGMSSGIAGARAGSALTASKAGFWKRLGQQYAGGGGGGMLGIGDKLSGMISEVGRPNFSGLGGFGGGPGAPQTQHESMPAPGISYTPPVLSTMALRERRNPGGDFYGPLIDQMIRNGTTGLDDGMPSDNEEAY